jgi:hypothetical protein
MAVEIHNAGRWIVTPCSLVTDYIFGECLHVRGMTMNTAILA